MHKRNHLQAFTIVELLIVIVIIAILAAVTVVAYAGIQNRAIATMLKSDLHNGATQLGVAKAENGSYPISGGILQKSVDTSLVYLRNPSGSYCLSATSSRSSSMSFYITSDDTVAREGSCPIEDGISMQSLTGASCPSSSKVRVVDARDNHTYWAQKLADGKCWMLTNLAYAGGGTNTYGDTKVLTNGTGSPVTYTVPSYYVVPSTTNYTTEPTNPSISTGGTGQYGYLYNFCAAMGGQLSTSACANATTPETDTSVSICPTGWRVPTSGTGAEFPVLNNTVNGGSATSASGLLSSWLVQRSGSYNNSSFYSQGDAGYYWSSSNLGLTATGARSLYFSNTYNYLEPAYSGTNKNLGLAVRCIAV